MATFEAMEENKSPTADEGRNVGEHHLANRSQLRQCYKSSERFLKKRLK